MILDHWRPVRWAGRAGIILVALALFGCKAGPAPEAGFIENPEDMVDTNQLGIPWHRVWKKWDADFGLFNEIMIAPVNVQYVMEQSWWRDRRTDKMEDDLQEIAEYAHEKFVQAFGQEPPQNRYRVVEVAGPRTLVLELAIVELVPTPAVASALTLSIASRISPGTVAFEARLRDGGTKEVVATAADREARRAALVTAKDFSWYAHAYGIIDDWAIQFVQVLNRNPTEKIPDSWPFELRPW